MKAGLENRQRAMMRSEMHLKKISLNRITALKMQDQAPSVRAS